MDITIYYRKNLKLTPQKLASACSHVSASLLDQWKEQATCYEHYYPEDTVIKVLMASDRRFNTYVEYNNHEISHLHVDKGLTEVEPDTPIAFGFIE